MTTAVQPYLYFGGRCEEAIEFYKAAIGAKVEMMMRFDESSEPPEPSMIPAGFEKKVMHASLRIGDTVIMASDGNAAGAVFHGFSLALSVATEEEADRAFGALSEGGKILMPLMKTFWSPKFGMLTDRFGVSWMVITEGEKV